MRKPYLSPPSLPPAIRDAMAKATERKEKGLPVYDFSSGNVGALPLNMKLFEIMEIKVNENLPKSLKPIAEGIRAGLLETLLYQPISLAYSPTGGTTPVKQVVIRYFREIHGVPLSDNDINKVIITTGGQQAMTASLRSLKRNTEVLMLEWDYSSISEILQDHGLKETRVKMNENLTIDFSDFDKKIGKNQVFYLSMPNNPTGYTSIDDLKRIVKSMVENEGGVIWDAPYIFMLLKLARNKAIFEKSLLERTLKDIKEIGQKYHEDVCILSSLSKTCLIAGLRFGMATANEDWITNMNAIIGRENLSSVTLSLSVGKHILEAFLKNPITHEWTCKVLADRLTVLIEELSDYLILPGSGIFGGLYALIRTPEDGNKFAKKLVEEYGIVTVPGSSFCGKPVNMVRLSLVATPWKEGDETWIKSVRSLKKALS